MKNGMIDGLWYKDGWRSVGPGGGGGQLYPAFSPFDDDHMIQFSDMSGSYMTRDGGKTWTPFSLKFVGYSAAFHPKEKEVVYAGASGLYKSVDGGRHWSLVYPEPEHVKGDEFFGDEAWHCFVTDDDWPGGVVQSITFDSQHPEHIAFALAPRSMKSNKPGPLFRVYYSADGGKTWRHTTQEMEGKCCHRLFFDPSAPVDAPRIFAFTTEKLYEVCAASMQITCLERPEGAANIFSADAGTDKATGKPVLFIMSEDPVPGPANPRKRLWRSMDAGKSWQAIDYGQPSRKGASAMYSKMVACCEADASTVYIIVVREDEFYPILENYAGIKKSTDMGETWEWVLAFGLDEPEGYEAGWMQRSYGYMWTTPFLYLSVSPVNPNALAFTTTGSSGRTLDGGKTWHPLYTEDKGNNEWTGRGLEVTTCYGVHFDPHHKDSHIITYTDIGMFRTENGGHSWKHSVSGVPFDWANSCYWMVYDPEVPGRMWGAWGVPHDIPRQKLFNRDMFNAGLGTHAGGVTKSDNGAQRWKKSNCGMDERAVSTSIILDPTSPVGSRTLYVASVGFGVYKSTDDGATWQLKNNGLGDSLYSYKLYRRNDGAIFLINLRAQRDGRWVPGELYVSYDGAENWQKLPLPEGVNAPNDLDFDPRNPDKLYLACWPFYQNAEALDGPVGADVSGKTHNGGLHVTEDLGKTWKKLVLPKGQEYTYGVTVDECNPDRVFVVDFQQNCHRSDDAGATWERISGYSFKWGHKAFIDPHNRDYIFITGFGNSVWYGPAAGNGLPYEDMIP